MKAVKKAVLMAGALVAWASLVLASGGGAGISADEAVQKLMDGNKRYVDQQMVGDKQSDAKARESLAKGQKPYAIILSCSDSRVPPEVIFDQGLGEIFVVRVAGNVPDPIVLGSIEYAADHLGSPVIMVLGHERCGAVTAAVDAKGEPHGNIGAIMKQLAPAVKQAKKTGKGLDKAQLIESATDQNIKLVAANLTKQSPMLKKMVSEHKVSIVGAKYDLDDGKVSLVNLK